MTDVHVHNPDCAVVEAHSGPDCRVRPIRAWQHLNRDGRQETLCGYPFGDIASTSKVYDYRDGYHLSIASGAPTTPACLDCQQAADLINR